MFAEQLEDRRLLSGGAGSDDFSDDFDRAALLLLAADGAGSQAGSIEVPGDVDTVQFVAHVTGWLVVRQDAAPGSRLDSLVRAFDDAQRLLSEDDDGGEGVNSLLEIRVTAGRTYYIQATAFGRSTGGYNLSLATTPDDFVDDFGDDFGQAAPLQLSADGSGALVSSIEVPGDVDTFRFVAPVTRRLAVRLDAAPGSDLDCLVSVFDEAQEFLDDDDDSGSGYNSLLYFRAVAGRTYYIQATSAFDEAIGGYLLSLAPAPDDFGDDFDQAAPLQLSADGSGALASSIEEPGDVDTFRFVAPVTGRLAVRLDAAPGSDLDCLVSVFDEAQEFLDDDINSGSGYNSLLYFRAVAGRTYYIQAAASDFSYFDEAVGEYLLSLAPAPDDFGDDFDQAAPLQLSADGSGALAGSIEVPGDIDTFRFVAPMTGRIVATLNAALGSSLDPALTVLDSARNPLDGQEEEGPGATSNQATFDVIVGQTYYLRAIASPRAFSGREVGAYTLGLSFQFTVLAGRELEPNNTLGAAAVISADSTTIGTIGRGDVDLFAFKPLRGGRLIARVHAEGARTRLSLLDEQGRLLVQSDGISPSDRENQINQHVAAGTYYLRVESLAGAGVYSLATDLMVSSAPPQVLAVGGQPGALASGDFNGDGRLDLATANQNSDDVSVLLGYGDGAFQDQRRFAVGDSPQDLVAGDFNGDGRLDLATANAEFDDVTETSFGTVSVLLGRGDGTFQDQVRLAVGGSPLAIVAGDFNGDGRLDLTTANADQYDFDTDAVIPGDVSVLLGRGDGTFQDQGRLKVGADRRALVAGDFNGDGLLDLATPASVVLGRGDGTFQDPVRFAAGDAPSALVTGDFNGDSHLDLATTNTGSDDVSVLLGRGDGTFQDPVRFAPGARQGALVTGDFNGDSHLDLATENLVLLGRGDGTFQDPVRFAAVGSRAIMADDFNADGRLDLATAYYSPGVSVLLGRGDGTFQDQVRLAVGGSPLAIVSGDFDADGRLDLATANDNAGGISVLLGHGDGTFQDQVRLAVGDSPRALVTGDFNADGRFDLATANANSSGISMLLGRGDGTFQDPVRFAGGDTPGALVTGDFNGDGHLDLATTNAGSDDVSVLLGRGDGTFRDLVRFAAGDAPGALVTGDFNGDGHLDLATPASVLLGRGDGTFRDPVRTVFGSISRFIVAGDFNGDGRLDLATGATSYYGNFMLLGRGDGTFQSPVRYGGGGYTVFPLALVVGDFNGDDRLDLAIANSGGSNSRTFSPNDVSVLLGRGDGSFQERRIAVEADTLALAVGDFNGDGRFDLAATSFFGSISVKLNLGDGTFASSGPATNSHPTPLLADLEHDGADDVLIINRAGEILWRKGRPQEPGTFEPPLIVNPGVPSRDIAVLDSYQGPLIASVDARADAVSLFARCDGRFVRIDSLLTGLLPVQIATADLDGDGSTDLVVRNAGGGSASVYLGDGFGNFLKRPDDLSIGLDASDLRLADVDQSGTIDLLVTNQSTGDVRILFNRGDATFTRESRYYASNGLYRLVDNNGTPILKSLEETAGVAVGTFFLRDELSRVNDDALPVLDLVTINPGSNTLGVLAGLGHGAFASPRRFLTDRPIEFVRAADINGDGVSDVVLLGSSRVTISLGDGRGGFTTPITLDAGLNPTSLAIADVDQDGKLDLLVGNDFGDVLVLLGNGDGTFRPFRRVDQGMALAVADLDGDSRDDFVFANQALDRVVVEFGGAGTNVVIDRSEGLLAPGAVALADLNRDGQLDLVVANSGSNNVLIYLGQGDGQFGPAVNGGRGFFTGTNPVAIAVADVGGDESPDLVVTNRGSNDVSVLLGSGQGDDWTLLPGTRYSSSGIGPVSTLVQDVDENGLPDLLISNSVSNDVRLVPGIGLGNFDDVNRARTISVGNTPGPVFVGDFDAQPGLDLVTINRGSNDLTLVPDFVGGTGIRQSISSGGLSPVAGFVGDFNTDGIFDLAVANNGDGGLALFLGGNTGPGLSQVLRSPTLPRPTALVFDSVSDGLLRFYASTAGLEAAFLLTFAIGVRGGGGGFSPPPFIPGSDPGIGSSPPPFIFPGFDPILGGDSGLPLFLFPGLDSIVGGGSSPPPLIFPGPNSGSDAPDTATPGATEQIAQLLPLRESALALVATLLTVALNRPTTEADAAAAPDDATELGTFSTTETAAPNQGATQPEDQDGATDEADDAEEEPDDEQEVPQPEEVPDWIRFIAGLNEEFDRMRRESTADLPTGAGPPALAARLLAVLDAVLDRLAQDSDADRPGLAERLRQAAEPVVQALDAAIDLLWSEEAPPSSASTLEPIRSTEPGDADVSAAAVPLVLAAALLARRAWPSRRRRRGRRIVLADGRR